jgi:hypothetical protein
MSRFGWPLTILVRTSVRYSSGSIVQLTGLDQRGDSGPVFGAAVRSREQRIFPGGTFDGIVVELFPARQGVTDGFGKLALLTDQTKFCPQPRFKGIDEWSTFLLPDGATFVGAAATDVLLDGVKHSDMLIWA